MVAGPGMDGVTGVVEHMDLRQVDRYRLSTYLLSAIYYLHIYYLHYIYYLHIYNLHFYYLHLSTICYLLSIYNFYTGGDRSLGPRGLPRLCGHQD